ncbi:MAG: efflux RND transporter periplasmic adaptor subunit [Flavobacteriaceae bacterium]
MKKKNIILLTISIVILLSLLVGAKKMGWVGKNDLSKKVEWLAVSKSQIVEKVSATGKIQPEVEVKLSSEVSGEIIALPIKEGQQVKKGDLLVKINPDIIQSMLNRSEATYQNVKASLAQAEASLKEAEANYRRNESLFAKGVISKAEWDRSIAAYETSKAARKSAYYSVKSAAASVNEAKDNLGRTTIYAPMDGTISLLNVELGERVVGTQQMAGTELLRVANLNDMEVEVDVNENEIVKVNVGDSAIVEVDAYLKKSFKGLVTAISNASAANLSADQVTNFEVKIKILKSSYAELLEGKSLNYAPFRPGMTATVDIITETKSDAVTVPISAIVVKTDTLSSKASYTKEKVNTSDELFECVFVKNGNEAKLRVVETGIQDDSNIEVLSGLKDQDTVITGPYAMVSKSLKPGDKISQLKTEKED